MLSTGEQVEVKRIRQKVDTGQVISEKERQFIKDMSSLGRGPAANRKAELSYTS